jgi:copper chaperone CopZ
VEKALVRVDGYKRMTADVQKQKVQVEYDPAKTDPQKLAKAITENTEYKASVMQ